VNTGDCLTEKFTRLFDRTAAGVKPGLETITALLEGLDNPHHGFAAIHIAGTNGKGSVAAILESILRTIGLSTGLYTSPHLVNFAERIKIDGIPAEEKVLEDALTAVEQADREQVATGGRQATFFEMATAMAFLCFKRCGVHVAVIETGMGGSWDATNVVRPVLSVITPISVEHENYLGSDIAQIAAEKAGIIKEGVPAISAEQEEGVASVLSRRAEAMRTELRWASESVAIRRIDVSLDGQKLKMESTLRSYPPVICPLLGRHQIDNCALALLAAEIFSGICSIELSSDLVKEGIEGVKWPGRAQVVKQNPLMIVDGAHNPAAAHSLNNLLKEIAQDRKHGMIVGFLADKDAFAFMNAFAGKIDRCWIVPIKSPRAMDVASVESAVVAVTSRFKVCSLNEACIEADEWATAEHGMVCVTGSLYLVGEFLAGFRNQSPSASIL